MVGRSQDAHNECSAPALLGETPKALHVAVVEDDPRIQQLISAEITDEAGTPGGRLATPEAQSCRDRAPVRQASSKRLRSMGTAEPPPWSSLRSLDVITR